MTVLTHQAKPQRQWWTLMMVIVASVALVISALILRHQGSNAGPATITVTGNGSAKGAPDTLSYQIGVNSSAGSASAALTMNNSRVRTLESSLISNGISRHDMQTSGLDVYTNTNSSGRITGFTVSNVLNVSTHHLTNAGQALDAAVRVAGNGVQLNNVSFSLSHQSRVLAAARANAMANAHAAAQQYAQASSSSLGRVLKISEQQYSMPQPIALSGSAFVKSAAGSVPLQSGTATVTADVTVVYALSS